MIRTRRAHQAGLLKCAKLIVVAQKGPDRSKKTWDEVSGMTKRSFELILLTLRTVLSGEDDFEVDLSSKTNPR